MQFKSQTFLLLSSSLIIVAGIQYGLKHLKKIDCCGHQTAHSPSSSCTRANSSAKPVDWLRHLTETAFTAKQVFYT